jgi:hypothetical protein
MEAEGTKVDPQTIDEDVVCLSELTGALGLLPEDEPE